MGTLNGNLVAPSQTLSGELTNTSLHGDVEAPAASVTGELTNGLSNAGSCTAPLFECSGTIISGNVLSGAVVAPAASVTGSGGSTGHVTVPVPVVTGELLNGSVLSGAVSAPKASASGEMSSTNVLSGAVSAPRAVVVGTLRQGQELSAALNVPAATAAGRMLSGSVLAGEVTAPAAAVVGTLAFGQILTGALVPPSQEARGTILNELVEVLTTWLFNTEGGGATNYTNFPFHTLVEFNGSYYGVSSAGVSILGGDTDDGDDIDAFMEFGLTDLESDALQRLGTVVFDMRANGMLKLHVTIDGEDETVDYQVEPVRPGLHPVPVPTGRGLRSRNWQFAISNVNGADFDISAVDFGNKQTNRRAG